MIKHLSKPRAKLIMRQLPLPPSRTRRPGGVLRGAGVSLCGIYVWRCGNLAVRQSIE